MKKAVAMFMAVVMMLAFGVTAFAAYGPLTVEQAKQVALDYAGVRAADASFTKAWRDWDDGREVYEIEFYANNTEYDMDVDVNTGRVTDFSMEYHGGYSQPGCSAPSQPSYGYGYYDDDWDDWDDRYDRDLDDWFDHDFDDRYDHYFDDWFDWDD